MINSLSVVNDLGERLTIELRSPEKSGFFVQSIDGLGPSKSDVNMTESLYLDGSYYNSSRVVGKNIVLKLGFYDDGVTSIETLRQQTYRFFRMKKPITLEISTDNRTGVIVGYIESNDPDIFSNQEDTVISFVSPSAYFSGLDTVQSVFSGVEAAFEFPFENTSLTEKTLEMGHVFINTESNVFYSGDVPTGVVIFINALGAASELSIVNVTNGETMILSSAKIIALTGSGIVNGDQIIISTVKGMKYVYLIRAGTIYNILDAVSANSNWFTIDRGDNVFTYTASSGLANLQFLIEHQPLYQGL